ncbi:thiolase domain-containing protein [bacterium]|nr:thiolase domain-containing protein [bacterium]
MRDVAVIGIGIQKWGELWDRSLRDLWVEAAQNAINDAGVDHIDTMYVGAMSPGLFVGQEHLSSLCADYLGVTPVAATRVESACCSGGMAMRSGFIEVASGMADIALVSGVEKMTDVDGGGATFALATAADGDYEVYNGVTFPGLYAMMAQDYMHRFGLTREELAAVPVKSHANGALNPHAQFQHPTTVEGVVNSVMVADPLTIMDCSPITDGAAAAILCPLEMAKDFAKGRPIIKVSGVGAATDTIALHSRKDFSTLNATVVAARRAYDMAGVGPDDIDFAEVHDCFSIAEVITSEDIGFFEKGTGGKAAAAGETALNGKRPVNTSGGLKSKGHPVGATGVGQIHELVTQLRGDAGERQLKTAKRGLAQNMGGSGGSAVVHILEVV